MEWCHLWHCWHNVILTQAPLALHNHKSYITHYFNHLDTMNTVVLWRIPLASHDADACASSVKWLKKACWISLQSSGTNKAELHDHKCHVAPCFNHLDLTNKMVSLTMPAVLYDVLIGANSITSPIESCFTLFQLSSPNEQNDATDNAVSITWQQWGTNGIKWFKKSCLKAFWPLWRNKCNNIFDNTVAITICLDMSRCIKTCQVIVWTHIDIV